MKKKKHNQILKLLKGKHLRVKHGSGYEINASEEQHKIIMRAHKKKLIPHHSIWFVSMWTTSMFKHKKKSKCREALLPAGYGCKKKGKGMASISKTTAKLLAPIVIDEGSKFLEKKSCWFWM